MLLFSQWKRCSGTRWLTVTSVEDAGKWKHIDICCGTVERQRVWQAYNAYLICIRKSICKVLSYDDVFVIRDFGLVSKVKMKVIQEMIQIDRPVNWLIYNVFKIANELKI
jgi:hypothetical protein